MYEHEGKVWSIPIGAPWYKKWWVNIQMRIYGKPGDILLTNTWTITLNKNK